MEKKKQKKKRERERKKYRRAPPALFFTLCKALAKIMLCGGRII